MSKATMSRSKSHKLLVVLLSGLLSAGGVWALKTDKSQPINVRADHGDFKSDPDNNSNGTGIYTGNVVITQGSIQLTADKAVLHVVDNELDTADITGNPATFQQQPDNGEMVHGTAQEITYSASKNEIMLITDARLTQTVMQQITNEQDPTAPPRTAPGERLMTADRIRYDTDTQHVIAKGGSDEDRVHLSFPPKTQPPAPEKHARRPVPAAATGAAPTSRQAPGAATTPPPPGATQPGNRP